MISQLETWDGAASAVEDAIARTLDAGSMAAELPVSMRALVAARRTAGECVHPAVLLSEIMREVLAYERTHRRHRDPWGRSAGAQDPVVAIARCCIEAAADSQSSTER